MSSEREKLLKLRRKINTTLGNQDDYHEVDPIDDQDLQKGDKNPIVNNLIQLVYLHIEVCESKQQFGKKILDLIFDFEGSLDQKEKCKESLLKVVIEWEALKKDFAPDLKNAFENIIENIVYGVIGIDYFTGQLDNQIKLLEKVTVRSQVEDKNKNTFVQALKDLNEVAINSKDVPLAHQLIIRTNSLARNINIGQNPKTNIKLINTYYESFKKNCALDVRFKQFAKAVATVVLAAITFSGINRAKKWTSFPDDESVKDFLFFKPQKLAQAGCKVLDTAKKFHSTS